jgi:hypothetical protein
MTPTITIDFNAPIRIYRQIADAMRHLLVNGALSPGDQVPTALGTGDGTPDACWKYGLIYYNPKDPHSWWGHERAPTDATSISPISGRGSLSSALLQCRFLSGSFGFSQESAGGNQ